MTFQSFDPSSVLHFLAKLYSLRHRVVCNSPDFVYFLTNRACSMEKRFTFYQGVISCRVEHSGFSRISPFLEGIRMEHIDMKNSLDSKVQVYFICSVKNLSGN